MKYLDVRAFDVDPAHALGSSFSGDLIRRVEQVRVDRCSGLISDLMPYLVNVKTLVIGDLREPAAVDDVSRDAGLALAPTSPEPLPCLQRLKAGYTTRLMDTLLRRWRFPSLVVLSLAITHPAEQLELERTLPTLGSLGSLGSLDLRTSSETFPLSFLAALSSTSISHCSLDAWPTPALLASLPASFEYLETHIHRIEYTVLNALDEISDWKADLPALRAVRIAARDPGGFDRECFEAAVEEVEELEIMKDDEEWRRLVPVEWRIE